MVKLNLDLSITLPIPNQNFGSHKVGISVAGLDVDGDVEAQLATWFAAIPKASEIVEQGLDQVLANLTGHAIEGLGLSQDVSGLDGRIAEHTSVLENVVNALKNHKDRLAAIEGGATLVVETPAGAVKVTAAPDERPVAEAAPQTAPTVQETAQPVAEDTKAKPKRTSRRKTKAVTPEAAPEATAPEAAAPEAAPAAVPAVATVATPAPTPAAPVAPAPEVAPAPAAAKPATVAAPAGETGEDNPFRK